MLLPLPVLRLIPHQESLLTHPDLSVQHLAQGYLRNSDLEAPDYLGLVDLENILSANHMHPEVKTNPGMDMANPPVPVRYGLFHGSRSTRGI